MEPKCAHRASSYAEALCFRWIDAVRRSIDTDSYAIRLRPQRRSDRTLGAVKVKRVVERMRNGRMPRGLRAYNQRSRKNACRLRRREEATGQPAARLGVTESDARRTNIPVTPCSRKPVSMRVRSNTRQTCLSRPVICAASAAVSLTPGGSTNRCWTRASASLKRRVMSGPAASYAVFLTAVRQRHYTHTRLNAVC
jgi:hypothetical protein